MICDMIFISSFLFDIVLSLIEPSVLVSDFLSLSCKAKVTVWFSQLYSTYVYMCVCAILARVCVVCVSVSVCACRYAHMSMYNNVLLVPESFNIRTYTALPVVCI